METEYLDEEQVIALYNKVRTGKRTWPTGIWSSPAALQYAVTVFDYWIHNVMGWKGWPDARGKVTPALLEEHRLADLVESVFVPEFGDDWLDFEVVLNESMRLSEDEGWAPDVADRQERVEAAFEHAFEKLIDRLLASPQYGERWGRHWLDLARYADTNGYEKDDRRTIWPYRDWVIDAFNRDLPFVLYSIGLVAPDGPPPTTRTS